MRPIGNIDPVFTGFALAFALFFIWCFVSSCRFSSWVIIACLVSTVFADNFLSTEGKGMSLILQGLIFFLAWLLTEHKQGDSKLLWFASIFSFCFALKY